MSLSVEADKKTTFPDLDNIYLAAERLRGVASHTALQESINLSDRYGATIFLKREDQQVVRSYKLRGAYNKMASLSAEALAQGVVCASAGNHAQGVAYACRKMAVRGTIFMPSTTPNQKVKQVKLFGKEFVEVVLTGDTFDDAYYAAIDYVKTHDSIFVHPFDDLQVIEGQGTVGLEIFKDSDFRIDYLLMAIGGGGLAAGVSTVFNQLSPKTKLIGVEPLGSPSMKVAIDQGHVVTLHQIDKFVDGAAVKRVGETTFEVCRQFLDRVILVPEGQVCTTILKLYDEDAIVAEPAGALTIAALDLIKDEIKGKNVVCLVSGGNNDITRTEEIKERSLLYEGLKHYFIIRFPQRSGAFREFLNVLGPTDDITRFEYIKKTNRENGPAVVGIELKNRDDFEPLIQRMKDQNIVFDYLNDQPNLFQFLV
ncbi:MULTISPECIES: threonine ammonia-lyase IlvA [Spirosoma]|uniref:L-threonine dehydratase n=1 Tax=Spirosoma liriopis TaxID=2937440 RepID=A0ABT0HIM5_9BACT|nr:MULTISPECIES: threonine ammonia-lyase IlvA [Spirosoma]MCK8492009.1 threonine ammonia-lyase IlvA [Spirosoma liriopis]UHG91431.1 threonine ammonia-lyase IlvA [Spirosoma oryzicola]